MEPILTGLEPSVRPKLTATVFGILRRLLLIEHLLTENGTVPVGKLHPKLRAILTTGVYQLLYDDTIPDHAVIHSAVSLCIPHHKGYANAFLRGVSRERRALLDTIIPALALPLRYSFPPDLIDHLQGTFTGQKIHDILDYLNSEPVFHSLNVASFPTTASQAGIFLQRIRSHTSIQEIGSHELLQHHDLLQNISSQFISYFSSRLNPRSVLDLCAAPGSKSSLLAMIAPRTQIMACDLSLHRLKRLASRKSHQPDRFDKISLCCADALNPPFSDSFDLVVLDAPCSAFGTIRKHPDRRYDTSAERISELAHRQRQMIRTALDRFRRAQLLYSVCTFTRQETSTLIQQILQELDVDSTDFARARNRLSSDLTELGIPHFQSDFGVHILPDRQLNPDLFFMTLFPPSEKV